MRKMQMTLAVSVAAGLVLLLVQAGCSGPSKKAVGPKSNIPGPVGQNLGKGATP